MEVKLLPFGEDRSQCVLQIYLISLINLHT